MSITAPVLFGRLAKGDCRELAGDLEPELIQWLVDTGLGPVTLSALGAAKSILPEDMQQLLLAVDLSARFESSGRTEALLEILKAAGPDAGIGMLKGMLIAHEFYPQPHLRPMGDIDLLTAPDKTDQLSELLRELGYINESREDAAYYATHHHLMPFHLPGTDIWVEVHRGLFPQRSGLAENGPFDPTLVYQRTRPTDFYGLPILALTHEMQFFHTSVHWAEEFRQIGGMLGLLDLCMLLDHVGDSLNWDWIFSQSGNSMHIAPAQIALTYLERAGLLKLPPDVNKSLKKSGGLCSTALNFQHTIVDRYVVLGKPPGNVVNKVNLFIGWNTALHYGKSPLFLPRVLWNVAFPETESKRYKLGYQLKRFRNLRDKLKASS